MLFPARVLSKATLNPIPGAIVTAKENPPITPAGGWAMTADSCGWIWPNLAPGTYNLTITAPGYQDGTDTWTLKDPPSAPILVGLDPVPFPNPPSRAKACSVRRHFQGLTFNSQTYGPLPWFVAATISFENELDNLIAQVKAAGDTHLQIDLFWDYGEAGQPWGTGQLVPPRDLQNDYPTYLKMVDKIIQSGLIPIYGVFGEGGPQWIEANFQKLVTALRSGGVDRTKYGPFYVVYDGAWPATWTVQNMKDTLPMMRSIIGDQAYLGFMFATNGGRPYFFVESEADYSKPWMQSLDFVMMSEGDDQVQCPAMVNGMQYLLGPQLTPQGACTPQFKGPWLMAPGTPRGPYFAGIDEWHEYEWVRGKVTAEIITIERNRMDTLGIVNHG